jgi:hypothetical protein
MINNVIAIANTPSENVSNRELVLASAMVAPIYCQASSLMPSALATRSRPGSTNHARNLASPNSPECCSPHLPLHRHNNKNQASETHSRYLMLICHVR